MVLAGEMAVDPTLIYGGDENYRQKGTRVLSWHSCQWISQSLPHEIP
jgi:hypothetical protein